MPLSLLAEAIERVQGDVGRSGEPGCVRTGWEGPDRAAGGLRLGAVHEWLVDELAPRGFVGPLGVFVHLARRAQEATRCAPLVVWVGRACWAYPRAMPAGVLEHSVFVDACDRTERVWAADLALRSRAAGVVIADATGVDMSASRRLQLAAGVGGTLCLLARPWRERRELSAAWTRWRVESVPSETDSPRWAVELLRCKGVQPAEEGTRRWCVRRDHETGDVRVVPDAGDRPGAARRPAMLATA